jgi:hypothetical protein
MQKQNNQITGTSWYTVGFKIQMCSNFISILSQVTIVHLQQKTKNGNYMIFLPFIQVPLAASQ